MFERRLYYHIDWALLIAVLALCALGVAMIFSTAGGSPSTSHLYVTQLYAIVLGLGAMVVTLTIDYRAFTDKSHLIYIGLLAALLYVDVHGRRADGRASLDSDRLVQLAAVGVREGRGGPGAREVLRRESRRAPVDRSGHRRWADLPAAGADRQGT